MTDFDERRRTGIGGSDAAAAIGISPWKTPFSLWLQKVGEEAETLHETEPMRWGTLLEPIIAAEYARRTGRVLERNTEMLRHPNFGWMIAHLDATVIGENRIVEVKTARDGRYWGPPGTDEVPMTYLMQAHHYLVITGAAVCDIAVLIGGSDFRIYEIPADDEIAGMVIDHEATFWRYVEQREPPPPIHLSDVVRRWGRLAVKGAVLADRVELLAIEQLRRIRDDRATLDAMEEANKAVVLQALADKGEALVDDAGNVLATWKLDGGRKGYTVEPREPARRFLLRG